MANVTMLFLLHNQGVNGNLNERDGVLLDTGTEIRCGGGVAVDRTGEARHGTY